MPGLVWLSGLKSDMASTKASAVAEYAAKSGQTFLRFDYSGHGVSEGRFEDGTVSRWLEETVAAFAKLSMGPQVVIGSSMGGYMALLLARYLLTAAPDHARRIRALVLIAPAWDMTEALMWAEFPPDARRDLIENGVFYRPSDYGEPYALTRALIEDGRAHLFAGTTFDPGCPVIILQGGGDESVPIEHVRKLVGMLSGRAEIIEVPDGDHRLSRPEDITLLLSLVERASRLQSPS